MAQPIAPEVWIEGIDDNRLLPSRYTNGLFIGSYGANVANNLESRRVWDIQVSDYITDYDDRRLNGLAGVSLGSIGNQVANAQGNDGWGASAYGVFQDVRFDSYVYTSTRHRSTAFRIFQERQHDGAIGNWGTETTSNAVTAGEALMKTAQMVSKTVDLWKQTVLGPDIDRYNLHAILNGRIRGRWVPNNPDTVCQYDGIWVAEPGMVQGQALEPEFAPISAVEWDDTNIPLLLENVSVTWKNLYIPDDNRTCVIDPMYRYRLMVALIGSGVPPTDLAYADLRDGTFTRLMGWDFDFQIPSQYWPQLYVDDNLNVVHSATGAAAYDSLINSVTGGNNPDLILQNRLAAADRMVRTNFIRTVWDNATKTFKKEVWNYPLGQPGAVPYLGVGKKQDYDNYSLPDNYPFTAPGSGYGLQDPTGPVGTPARRQVIGMFLYKKAAQVSQEYDSMVTSEGLTRGKFTEVCLDVKYDAWAIRGLSHGIIPIIDSLANTGVAAVPVQELTPNSDPAAVTDVTATPASVSLEVNGQALPEIVIAGTGKYDTGYTAVSADPTVARVNDYGVIVGIAAGSTTVTYTSNMDAQTATVAVTVA